MARTSKLEPSVADPSEQLEAMFDGFNNALVVELIHRCQREKSTGLLADYLRAGGYVNNRLRKFLAEILEGKHSLSPVRPKAAKRVTTRDIEDMVEKFTGWLTFEELAPCLFNKKIARIGGYVQNLVEVRKLLKKLGINERPDGTREIRNAALALAQHHFKLSESQFTSARRSIRDRKKTAGK